MDKQRVIMFYELCRLCLENPGSVHMFETQDLVKDIYTCTTVKVNEKDKLPQKICTKCYEITQSSAHLRIIATKNDLHLRSLFGDDIEDNSEDSIDVIEISTSSQTSETMRSIYFINNDAPNIQNDHASSPNSGQSRPCTPKIQVISVRKDIFKSATAVDSSRRKSTEDNRVPCLEFKPEQNFPRPIKVEKIVNASECIDSSRRRSSEDKSSHLIPDQKVPKSIKEQKDFNELECKICNKFFDTPKKLYLHQRMHSKKILCPLDACGKKFATKGDLEKHIRTHTGERPYQCEICERSFAQRGTLKAHRDALHGGEGYLLGK